MSRLSGFIAYDKDGEEMFSVTWKNCRTVDTKICEYINHNKKAFEDNSLGDDDNITYFCKFETFKSLFLHLSNILTKDFFEYNSDLLLESAEDALYKWQIILDKILNFLDYHSDDYLETLSYEYFSCF